MSNQFHDDWEQLFQQLPVDTTAREEHRAQLKGEFLAAYQQQLERPAQQHPLQEIGRILMRYKAPYWTAASILLACVVWFLQSGSSPVFAVEDVVNNLVKARSARFDMSATVTGQPTQTMKAFYLEPAYFRQELTNGYLNIADWQAGKMIGLDLKSKQATVFNLVNLTDDAKRKMQTNQFDAIRDSLRQAVTNPSAKIDSLGEKQLDGRTVVGYRFREGPQPMTLWADPKTRLPVRIEATMAGPPATEVVMSNYEFNVELDKSMFNLAVPAGYQVVEANVDVSPPAEKEFVTALQMCTKAMKGEFPTGFDATALAKYVAAFVLQQGIDKEKGVSSAQMQEVIRIGRGFQFATMLPAESDAHYAGAGAKDGDTNRPVFWYKPAQSNRYRVIYADFSVKESDAAPEVAGATKLGASQK